MRCFVAVEIPETLAAKASSLAERLRGLDTSIVPISNMHFTLKFLGEVDVKGVNEATKRLEHLAKNTKSFDVDLKGIGVFPNEKHIRVIWLGADNFLNLHLSVNDTLAPFFVKEKPVPHLTLARVGSSRYQDKILEFVNKHKQYNLGSMRVDKIKIKKSTLTHAGPVYEDVKAFELIG